LTLLSWLAPLLVVILLGFLASLPFVSLQPLWKTHFAGGLLLTSAGLVILFINCCYQDGAQEQTTSKIKRLAGTLGALQLIPLIGLALWALILRVEQYGWTVERITAAAMIIAASSYAFGYARAAVRAPSWLKGLELTNFITAYIVLALVLALFSPIADPARLMVSDQVARLTSGRVQPEAFDFAALKFDGARWGVEALTKLSQGKIGPAGKDVKTRAAGALAMTNRYFNANAANLTADDVAKHVTVFPKGKVLPAGFYQALLGQTDTLTTGCLGLTSIAPCAARSFTIQPGEPDAVLMINSGAVASVAMFQPDHTGVWRKTAESYEYMYCPGIDQELRNGAFTIQPHPWPDLVVGDRRIQLSAQAPNDCPPSPPSTAANDPKGSTQSHVVHVTIASGPQH
jgi:hypothetical protein